MRTSVIAIAASLCWVSLATLAAADTLVMRDGTRVQGTVVGIAARTITFRHINGEARRYPTSQVESLRFDSADRANPRSNGSGRRENNNGNGYGTIEAPAGTEIVVRTVELIDSSTAGLDQTFSAIVEQDVTDPGGRVIIAARSSAQLIIRQVSSGGASGSPEMVLDLQSITVDGRRYQVSTTDLSRENENGLGTNQRTAEAVGGGAALGTIIGAIAGGGKGAAIGGLLGAGGGASVQMMMRGSTVRVRAETELRFRLDRSVTLAAR